jgi:hypothetical protein
MGDTTYKDRHPMRCEVTLWHCLDVNGVSSNVLSLRDGRRDQGVRDSGCDGWREIYSHDLSRKCSVPYAIHFFINVKCGRESQTDAVDSHPTDER